MLCAVIFSFCLEVIHTSGCECLCISRQYCFYFTYSFTAWPTLKSLQGKDAIRKDDAT